MNYLEMLEHSFLMDQNTERADFISESIFEITTYDSSVGELFGSKAVEVCKAINDKTTFEYIKNENDYKWYLLMVNMPFFQGKLEWGTSIRGAWWDLHCNKEFTINSCGLYENGRQILEIKFNAEQWGRFVQALSDFLDAQQENTHD